MSAVHFAQLIVNADVSCGLTS